MMQGGERSDEVILQMLDLMERHGHSASEVAARFGITRSAVLGSLKRVRDDLAVSEAAPYAPGTGPAVREGNRDGDLEPLWWKTAREQHLSAMRLAIG